MILTVTLNPALDRTMIVPNFHPGFRHRATETVMLPGGKGINVARTAKALGRPVIATGFIGGRKGDQIVSDLNDEGILCDFVRVRGESRISTAVVDSDTNTVTEINEQGPEITPEELEMLHEKIEYLGKAADLVVFAGSIPPGLPDECYADMIQQVRGLGLMSLLNTYADPMRLGIKAGPDYAFPRLVEAEKVIGYEFTGMGDQVKAARAIRDMGAGSTVITYAYGCVAELAEGDSSRTYVGRIPDVDVLSPLGWGDTLAGGFAVRLLEGDSPAECLRYGLACSTANLIRYGAGVFWPADVERLVDEVVLEEVSAET